jgi:hypothetical protein
MPSKIQKLSVRIVRFVDNHQPGWVACEFVDAANRSHTFEDKAPIFTSEYIDKETKLPLPGAIQCEVLSHLSDSSGRELVRVSTARPLDINSTDGLSEFVVLSTQLTE